MAEAIFRKKVKEKGLADKIEVDSAGTAHWHIGKRPHEGTLAILDEYGIEHEGMTARQVGGEDLDTVHYVIAMDASNMTNLEKVTAKDQVKGETARLLDFVPHEKQRDVPDPYFTGNFTETYELVEAGTEQLLKHIVEKEGL